MIREDPDRQVVHLAWRGRQSFKDAEQHVWTVTTSLPDQGGRAVRLVESGLVRPSMPTWKAGTYQSQPGDWLTAFAMTDSGWALWKTGALTPQTMLQISTRKKATMKTKKLAKALAGGGRGATEAAAKAVVKQALQPLAAQFNAARAAFHARPDSASRATLQEAGRRHLLAKMVSNEHSREGNMDALLRSQRGMGTPIFKDTNPAGVDVSRDTGVDFR